MRGALSTIRRVAGRLFHREQVVPAPHLPALPFASAEEADRWTEHRLAERRAQRPVRSSAGHKGHGTRRAHRHDPLLGASQ